MDNSKELISSIFFVFNVAVLNTHVNAHMEGGN